MREIHSILEGAFCFLGRSTLDSLDDLGLQGKTHKATSCPACLVVVPARVVDNVAVRNFQDPGGKLAQEEASKL